MVSAKESPKVRGKQWVAWALFVFASVFFGTSSDGLAACAGTKGSTLASKDCTVTPAAKKDSTNSVPDTFKDVIAYALNVNPQIAFVRGQLAEAQAGVAVAEANNGFQLDSSLAAGYGAQSTTTTPYGVEILQDPAFTRAKRYIGSLSGKKLLYDFGATEATVGRAAKLVEAQKFTVEAKVNEIGYSIADAYLRVFETRELSKLNTENIAALGKIQSLVQANENNGNGTLADVKRVEARLVDARSVAADTEADLQNGIDAFRRLVKNSPGDLKPSPDLSEFAPKDASKALEILRLTSARLQSIDANLKAANLELEAKKASMKPQFLLQTDTTLKSYASVDWNNFDAQALVSMSYKLMDGGLAQGQLSQLLARIDEAQQQYTNERDQAEADLRKFYTTIESARSKTQSLQNGVDASAKAKDLYTDQFSGGKRTLFELLDIQTSLFNAQRAAVLNRFEERRATYSVLQTLGLFVSSANGDKNALVADASPAPKDESTKAEKPKLAKPKAEAKVPDAANLNAHKAVGSDKAAKKPSASGLAKKAKPSGQPTAP
jgi:outer membrane protein TolC